MTLAEERARFNAEVAPKLAADAVGMSNRWEQSGSASARFAYFADDQQFVVVAGAQEKRHVDLAFAIGLSYRADRQLVLVLPQQRALATLQRAAWFVGAAQPQVFLHDGASAHECQLPSQNETVDRLRTVKQGTSPQQELRDAATPKHLGGSSPAVHELVEWATTHRLLDAGHRRSERAWHCMGQRVLSIRSTAGGLAITAGIHYGKPGEAPEPLTIPRGEGLAHAQLANVQQRVEDGIAARLSGKPPIGRPDEHWLQAVIRRDPSLVGVEQPALRELPAWRPGGKGDAKSWGRGYIDLLGVDGHGDIRIVETKLAENTDDLFVLQGLDYYIWATAYRDVLLDRLGAPARAAFEIHYVVGSTTDGEIHLSKHAATQVRGLDPAIRWRFQTIHDWYGDPREPSRAKAKLLEPGELP